MSTPEPDFYDPEAWADDPEHEGPLIPTVDHGPVEVYLRNADEYLPLLSEIPHDRFAFSHSDLNKKFDPYRMLAGVLPSALDFSWLVVSEKSFSLQTRTRHEADKQPIRYPLWTPEQDPAVLLRWCERAAETGFDRIGVGWMKKARSRVEGEKYQEWVFRLAASNPHVRFHLGFASSFRQMFGLNFGSADFNPAYYAKSNRVWLPSGKCVPVSENRLELKWIHVLGFSVQELKTVEGRVRFNIASALWAAENYRSAEPISLRRAEQRDDPLRLLTRRPSSYVRAQTLRAPLLRNKLAMPFLDPDRFPQTSPDPDEPYDVVFPVSNAQGVPVRPRGTPDSDKILCNSCSLAPTCKVYREGSICTVSDSPTSRLAAMLGTRDTETIKGVLAEILAKQVDRYERSTEAFREDDESDILDLKRSEHLMKMENSLVRSTETFMKILDPQFRESNVPSINASTTNIYNPRVLVADVMKQLEDRGVDRSQITQDMIAQVVSDQQRVIEG